VIVPFAPGGVTDVIARLWAQRMSEGLGQQFYVENHAGGGSNLGMGTAARQPADGYSLMVGASSFTINPVLYKKIPYDPFKDFTAVSLLATTPGVLIVHPSLPAKSFQELVALVRANPGKYSYGMSGIGTPNHLLGELLKLSFGLDLVTVPFPGGGPAIQSTIAGHTPIAYVALTSIPALVEGGQVRALAVTGMKRSAVLPSVPTMLEMGVRGQEPDTFTGLMAPAGTPKDIIDRLNAETVKILAAEDIKQRLANLGSAPQTGGRLLGQGDRGRPDRQAVVGRRVLTLPGCSETAPPQGFGLGLVFVPLSTVAFITLPGHPRTNGTAMLTLLRNIGSSIGISVVTAMLISKSAMFHSQLVESPRPSTTP
jgi:tripartite-type tricarboxylate transporter receptor subunit TctC